MNQVSPKTALVKRLLALLWRKCTTYEFPIAVGGATAYFNLVFELPGVVDVLMAITSYWLALLLVYGIEKTLTSGLSRRYQLIFFSTLLALLVLSALFYVRFL